MKRLRGFTLIELMIAMAIGLIVTLASMTILADSEARRRTQVSLAGIDQSAQFIAYTLDSQLRNAGSGFSQSWPYTFGCKLNAKVSNVTIFPLPTLPAPFAGVASAMGAFRLAPVIILKNASQTGSDVLVIAAGTAGFGEIAVPFGSVPSASALNLTGTTSLRANDLILVADQNSGSATAPCLLEQAASTFSGGPPVTQVALAGSYYASSGADRALTDFSTDGMAIPLGNPANANPPTISLIGVGLNSLAASTATSTMLYSYNLLSSASTPVAVSDGVVELRALYGIDNVGDGLVHAWQDPASGSYAPAALLDGSAASAQRLARIKAIRLAMIVRTNLAEKTDSLSGQPVSPTTLTMFADLGSLSLTRTLSSDERNYRYRVIETTVPLRNLLMIAN